MFNNEKLGDLLLEHAGLIATFHNTPQQQQLLRLKGVVQIKRQWFTICLELPNFPLIRDMRCKVLTKHEMCELPVHNAKINANWTVSEFLQQLPQFVPQNECLEEITTTVPLYAEIAELYAPNDYKLHVNADYSKVRFTHFRNFEQHFLELALPTRQVLEHSLPDGMPWLELLAKCISLTALVQQFQNYLEKLREFYENLQELDELCHVLQPLQVTTKHNYRIFVLRKRVFLKLHIADALAPVASMSLHIMGPSYEVEQLRSMYSSGLKHWDADMNIYRNLLRIFDLCFFPMRPTSELQEDEEQQQLDYCNICLCHQTDDGHVPLISCDNEKCHMIYHAACLRQWFNALSDGKTFLNVSIGNCLNCKTKLSASFAELFDN